MESKVFFIDIPDRTVVGVPYKSWHFGSLTLPLKAYLKSKEDELKNNVLFNANINLMIGRKWGRKYFYFMGSNEPGESYQTGWSVNYVFGIAKVDLSKENTTDITDDSKFSVAALSNGISFGFQVKKVGVFAIAGLDTTIGNTAKRVHFRISLLGILCWQVSQCFQTAMRNFEMHPCENLVL
jgi:hypothetical protein